MASFAFWGSRGARGREVFFVAFARAPQSEDRRRIESLLDADSLPAFDATAGALVLPRFGVVSPWASKAGDICRRCRLDSVRRIERGWWIETPPPNGESVHDKMTEQVLRPPRLGEWIRLFDSHPPRPLRTAALGANASAAVACKSLARFARDNRIPLSARECEHLADFFRRAGRVDRPGRTGRDPTDAELLMFAQANSEHCLHKTFRGVWRDGDGETHPPLFDFIRQTHAANPAGVVVAFDDNAAILESTKNGARFFAAADRVWREATGEVLFAAKAETHNHPTAVSPFPGAATGAGGELRDEAAAGIGAIPRVGFSGFAVCALGLPGVAETAAAPLPRPRRFASAFRIMRDAPLGAAAYNNEFGRAALAGFFRVFEERASGGDIGFAKPLMLAGGFAEIGPGNVRKKPLAAGALVVHLGGPGMRIGMGGGGASSVGGGENDPNLDFDSVQRDNAQMQRRAQEVISRCADDPENPILSLHDVGAGGVANAIIEVARDAGRGAKIRIDKIPLLERNLSPAEIWCNESQERFIAVLAPPSLERFARMCERENCPFAVVGEITEAQTIVVAAKDETQPAAVDLPLAVVFADDLKPVVDFAPIAETPAAETPPVAPRLPAALRSFAEIARAVLSHPSVACKRFLVTIGDRTVGGVSAREQMVGPWQTPIADCAAFLHGFSGFGGVAFALGERAHTAAVCPAAAVRLALAEALTNLAAADVGDLRKIKLSVNWSADCATPAQRGLLRAAVVAVCDLCRDLRIGIVVGKDSLSMRVKEPGEPPIDISSPPAGAVCAFAPVDDCRKIWTPLMRRADSNTLFFVAPNSDSATAGSVAAQLFPESFAAASAPNVDAESLSRFWDFLRAARARNLVASYHDRSDGGWWAAVCETAIASNRGFDLILDSLVPRALDVDGAETRPPAPGDLAALAAALFCEAPGAVVEVGRDDAAAFSALARESGIFAAAVGGANGDGIARAQLNGDDLFSEPLADLRRRWERVSFEMAKRRDDADCATEEFDRDIDRARLCSRLTFDLEKPPASIATGIAKPRAIILREQGSNGQRELAAAFDRAGFAAIDLATADLAREDATRVFADAKILALGGGFSFGDVLGAGRGWAQTVLLDPRLADLFAAFFARSDSLTLGLCNGCQALSHLDCLMPGDFAFPRFLPNRSRRYEARAASVEALESNSPFLVDMAGLIAPIPCSHGEGRAVFDSASAAVAATPARAVLRFVDGAGVATERYPQNPNGSVGGATGFCSPDGRVLAMMPHPERAFRAIQHSWIPPEWGDSESAPWLRLFQNARRFAG